VTEKQKSALRLAALGGLVTVVVGGLTVGRIPLLRLLEQLREIGPIPFYVVFAVSITVGVPPTPFLLVAGAAFDLPTNLLGVAFAYSLSLAASYAYAHRLFQQPLARFLERKTPIVMRRFAEHPRLATVLVRLVPGFPYVLQNCLLAAVCRSFASYFLLSLPPILLMAYLYILVGRSLVDRSLLLLAPVLVIATLIALLYRHTTKTTE
jgi:uncharacterized membrane protein YdjX (TVP38/TMEM64 family)